MKSLSKQPVAWTMTSIYQDQCVFVCYALSEVPDDWTPARMACSFRL
ncbi:hypothetical protein 33 [Diadegma semiclausum ichnovirus]|nr:hypothetical protein 33 [Diadegma semiclausum ichnovirus]